MTYQMTRRQIFVRGMFAGGLLMLAAQAINWLYSSPADASDFRRVAVAVQGILGVLGSIWLARGIPGGPPVSSDPTESVEASGRESHVLLDGRGAEQRLEPLAAARSPIPRSRQ